MDKCKQQTQMWDPPMDRTTTPVHPLHATLPLPPSWNLLAHCSFRSTVRFWACATQPFTNFLQVPSLYNNPTWVHTLTPTMRRTKGWSPPTCTSAAFSPLPVQSNILRLKIRCKAYKGLVHFEQHI